MWQILFCLLPVGVETVAPRIGASRSVVSPVARQLRAPEALQTVIFGNFARLCYCALDLWQSSSTRSVEDLRQKANRIKYRFLSG